MFKMKDTKDKNQSKVSSTPQQPWSHIQRNLRSAIKSWDTLMNMEPTPNLQEQKLKQIRKLLTELDQQMKELEKS